MTQTTANGQIARHLVGVWNPSYAADAMSSTVALLLRRVRACRQDQLDEDDVYVWWGKVKSSNRQSPLPQLPDILAMDRELQSDTGVEAEMHLYLTDYRSLYVGHVAEITADDPREGDEGDETVPAFYNEADFKCDCWFRLFDLRRVVSDDTVAVVDELRQLRNTRYNDRPVSLYGGMVELPLIVTRGDGARYFEQDVRDKLIDGRFWVEFDADRTGIGELARDLRENVVGDDAWNALDPAARTFIATAESLFRTHRRDAAFDFSAVVIDLAKALELQTNILLRRALRDVPVADRRANVEGRTVDLAGGELWPLGVVARLVSQDERLNRMLKRAFASGGEWFTASLPPILKDLAELRNPAAHTRALPVEDARHWRDRILGIGQVGLLAELQRVRVK
jgi:hypothetical protein